ncbi:MAG: alcohol dehydrogenase catalytic domain-containing protein [Armatimonadota bacterium]|nr:alcohol dehydrogenase catalytic domain-containing protein [Armatimonadota bacterium]MDR7485980.1 alcohol dehydrogenase catalytic domain-containing protein [Armatimonadota bacterium]MDR7534339.1 alcohol dehydrogenase catalytic domain-containing protein [Armatimonadota bacterium]MDR7536901.1 alcohol dehydrogenase catalytic domain-containing protein [Armatimonadota bacterium]
MLAHEAPSRTPETMRAWALFGPGDLRPVRKPVPQPGVAEVLVKIAATAICGTDIEILRNGLPAMIEGALPFNGEHVLGHEYVGTVAALGPTVDEFRVGDRVVVEIHAGCGRCERCRHGMYTSCLNYSYRTRGHRANGFTTDGGFAEYAVNHVSTVFRLPDHIPFDEATLIVTAGTALYGLDVLGGLIAGESLLVIGPGPIGLMAVACGKALGAEVVLAGTRASRLDLGRRLGADHVINVGARDLAAAVKDLTGGLGVDLVMECSGAPGAVNDALYATKRGGRICLAAFSREPVRFDAAYLVRNNIYLYGIRGEGRGAVRRGLALMAQGKISGKPFITHRFTLDDLPRALETFEKRIDDAIKVVVTP